MTTKRATATRRGASRSSSSKRGSRKRSRSSRSRAQSSIWDTTFFADHSADLWAIALATVGVLLALALYGHAAGSLGRGVDHGLGAMVGWVRYLIPPVGVATAIAVIIGRRPADPLRASVAVALGLISTCGLADLAGGSPGPSGTAIQLRGAGGYVGAVFGHSLQHATGTAGAVVIFVAAFVVAAVLATGVSLHEFFAGVATGLAFLGRIASALKPRPRPAPLALVEAAPARPPLDLDDEEDEEDEEEEEEEEDEVPAAVLAHEEPKQRSLRRRRSEEPVMAQAVGEWRLPPLTLLTKAGEHRYDERQLDAAGEALIAALAAHGVLTRLVGRTVGPTVTRFELELGSGVKVARITSLHRDIAYAMASPDVRILAPIPGRSAIGVEVPNVQRQLVALGDVLSSDEARKARHPLDVALGRDIAGRSIMVNIADMPHLLISGATGAGKSSCINSLISSILFRSTPDQVRLILVDPKRVELGHYNGVPHLLTPVVVDPKKAANALSWAVKEMERRYDLLAEYGMRDIAGYNEAFDRGSIGARPGSAADLKRRLAEAAERARGAGHTEDEYEESGSDEEYQDEEETEAGEPERLPYIVVVVDELNDLMMVAARDVEESVVRIAQMARAVGIHLVLATQRPSVDVITGVIKANIPSRMAFAVSSLADSRVILDQAGAERLIGKGDMLLLTASSNVARRLQAPWVSEEEIREAVAHWRRQGRTSEPAVAISDLEEKPVSRGRLDDDDDELLETALELVVRSQLGSTSMLQRKLRVGFARAGRLMDLLERRGVVGPSEGSKARAVLMTPEEFEDRSA
ncbi:MAG: DNA translocase FtsK 4TM domain-containing protein [Acidimicrobiales bacterium]